MQRTPYDVLLRLRETEENRARASLAKAVGAQVSATNDVESRRAALLREEDTQPSDASFWQVGDLAHARGLLDLHEAEEALRAARDAVAQAETQHQATRRNSRSMGRLVDDFLAELHIQAQRREQREMDELAALRFVHA